jgi:hypothetical protein
MQHKRVYRVRKILIVVLHSYLAQQVVHDGAEKPFDQLKAARRSQGNGFCTAEWDFSSREWRSRPLSLVQNDSLEQYYQFPNGYLTPNGLTPGEGSRAILLGPCVGEYTDAKGALFN